MGCTKIIYDLLPEKLFMGYGEEQLSRTLTFDISQMQAELPGGVPMIAYMRPRDELGYLASGVTLEGSTLTWELSAHVMQYKGIGGAQIVLVDESGEETHILKSHVMQMLIGSSIPLTGGEPPEPWETWLEQILAAAARAESAAADAEAQADRAETAEAGAQQALIDAGSPVLYGRAQTLTDAQQQTARGNIAAASAADVSDLKSNLNSEYSLNLIDHSDNVGTGPYSATNRFFVDGVIPENAKINTIKYYCASATSGTITFEVWELENGVLSKVYDKTETPTASSINTAHINYETEKPCMISFQSSAGNARMDSLATGKTTLYISDLLSDTLSYSSLNSLSGFELCATIDYIVSIDKSYVPKTWGVLPASGETVTNVYTPKYRALLGRALQEGDTLKSVSVYSRSSAAPGQVKVELWNVSGTTMELTETYTSSFGSSVGTVKIPIDKVIEGDTRITVVYVPTSDSANWAWGRTEDNVGTGIYNTSDIVSSTLSLPSKSFGDVSTEFILNDYTPYVQMSFLAKNTKGIVTVGASDGYDFATIQSAIDGSDEGDTIIVSDGVYEESVRCAGKIRNIVGTNRNRCVLINHAGNYYTPPIEMNVGSIENMTIISDASAVDTSAEGANLAYCIHCDFGANSKNNSWIARNLKLENANRPCIGMGLHQDYSVLIEDCEMYSGVHVAGGTRGTMYFHTRNIAGVTNQNIKIKNCEIVCADTVAMTVMQLQSGKGKAEFIGNTVYSEQNETADSIIWNGETTVSFNSDFSLSDISRANTVTVINSL